jgi:hypothetical protein
LCHKIIRFFPSDLSKLVSLQLSHTLLRTYQDFPALESLTLDENWSNLQFIDAPKLRNLVLTYQNRKEPQGVTMSALRGSTVRPCPFLSSIFPMQTYRSYWGYGPICQSFIYGAGSMIVFQVRSPQRRWPGVVERRRCVLLFAT